MPRPALPMQAAIPAEGTLRGCRTWATCLQVAGRGLICEKIDQSIGQASKLPASFYRPQGPAGSRA